MNRYSIGRTAGPWASMTPPIRGGIYCEDSRLLDESLMDSHNTDTESSDNWSSCMGSLNSSSTSLNSLVDASASKLAPISGVTVGSLEGSSLSVLPVESASRNLRSRPRPQSAMHESSEIGQEARGHVSPKDYTSSAVQKLIDDDVRDYPSLDIETQRSITLKYQALHQRVKAEGFYDCRYLEYGKEVIRYLALFMAFILCLRGGWYLTSACFLGLFWVCLDFPFYWTRLTKCSIKSCSLLMMQDTEALRTISLPIL